jgi:predicted TIM-barrel fold metal-dependent hydrolase
VVELNSELLPLEVNAMTETRHGRVIDCHVHICPENVAQKNVNIISKGAGISPSYNGTVNQLIQMMNRAKISLTFASNIVLRSDLMKKANDWTANVMASNNSILGMGWIIPGLRESVEEVDRCIKELGFKGIKMHHSHFKILPSDRSNFDIYENIAQRGIPVLFHCGRNPYSSNAEKQYAIPSNFFEVIKSFPEMKIIFGHLAGYQDDPERARELINSSPNVFADTAIDIRSNNRTGFGAIVKELDARKIVFGSDYPIHDGLEIIDWICSSNISESEACLIFEKNALRLFDLPDC